MADYWKSNPRRFCDICQSWMADNKISIQNHEAGNRHKANVVKKVNEIEQKNKAAAREKKNLESTLRQLNDGAFVGMMKDIARDPTLAKRYGIVLTDEAQKQVQDRVAEDSKAKAPKPVTSVPKPIPSKTTCEWREATAQNGTKYYWNTETGVTQWIRPEGFSFIPEVKVSVKQEKDRLQQFVFNRLVELSESGSERATVAVHKAFNAPLPEESAALDDSMLSRETVEGPSPSPAIPKFEGPKIDLLGQWVTVEEEPAVKLPKLDLPGERALKKEPEQQSTWIDEEKEQAAAMIAHLGETTDDAIRNSSILEVGERQVTPGSLSGSDGRNVPRVVFRRGPASGNLRNFRTTASSD